jgi:hypothetical protein
VQLDLFAETTLVSDAIAVPDNKHPDHKFWIDGGTADVAVKWQELLV